MTKHTPEQASWDEWLMIRMTNHLPAEDAMTLLPSGMQVERFSQSWALPIALWDLDDPAVQPKVILAAEQAMKQMIPMLRSRTLINCYLPVFEGQSYSKHTARGSVRAMFHKQKALLPLDDNFHREETIYDIQVDDNVLAMVGFYLTITIPMIIHGDGAIYGTVSIADRPIGLGAAGRASAGYPLTNSGRLT